MFIFLYGEDTFRSLQKLREIVDEYKKIHKTGLNLIYFDCQNFEFTEFENAVQSVSMFQEKKLIILRNAFFNTDFKEKFLKWASEPRGVQSKQSFENIIVFYENQAMKKTDALFKFLKTKAKLQEFNFLTGRKLQDWVNKEFEEYGTKIEFGARECLINFVGKDLWQMSQEIKKLCAYKKTDKIVKIEDVELLVIPKIETDIFKTIDAIGLNNKKLALFLLRKHLAKGDSPLYLLSMINFQFRNLLSVKDFMEKQGNTYGRVKIPGMHPYVAQKSCYQARQFGLEKLKKIYQKLLLTDMEIKTGKIDARMALDMLIIGI
jgi:DNA polymerase-3 subunit delta